MRVKIHDTTYIFLLISFLSGYFEYMFLFLLTIFVHESGHYFFSKIVNFKYQEIIIYPFGGITKYNEDLNVSSNKELFVLLGGITFQILFFLLIYYLFNQFYVTIHVFNIIKRINYILISFNFMPVLPLDGGKLMNIIFDKIFSYRISNILTISVSIIFVIVFFLMIRSLLSLILTIFLIKNIIYEISFFDYKYNKFLLERYLNNYNFHRIKRVKSIYNFKRDCYHFIGEHSEKLELFLLYGII